MHSHDNDDKLLDWIARRVMPGQGRDAARVEGRLDAVPSKPFTEAEIARIVQKAQGKMPLRTDSTPLPAAPPAAKNGVHAKPTPILRWPGRPVLQIPPRAAWVAAAACAFLAAGALLWYALRPGGTGPDVAQTNGTSVFKLVGGKATMRLNSPATQLTLVDADKGRVHLNQGGVHLEMAQLTELEAEVETPAGTIAAAYARCYIYYVRKTGSASKDLAAVLVLDGQVRLNNAQGFETGEAGELILAELGVAPEKIAPALSVEDGDWTRAQEVLLLLQAPEVHMQLKLNAPQKEKLAYASVQEAGRVDELVQGLPILASAERKKRTSEFFTRQADELEAVLDEPQKQELRQLRIQHAGFNSLLHKDVCDKLKLDAQQLKNIKSELFKFVAAKQGLFVHGGGTSFDLNKGLAKLQQQQQEAIFKLLRPDQHKSWDQMYGKGEFHLPPMFGPGMKGFGFNPFSLLPQREEQLWDGWLSKTAKRAKMRPDQLSAAGKLLQEAKKDAAKYRQSKETEFKQLAADYAKLMQFKKFDNKARQALDQQAEALQLPIAQIGEEWKEDVLELLEPPQLKSLQMVGQKELPPDFHSFWEKFNKKGKKGVPGFEKHK